MTAIAVRFFMFLESYRMQIKKHSIGLKKIISENPMLRSKYRSFICMVIMTIVLLPLATSQFAQLVNLTHSCNGSEGSAEFEILGNPDDYTYYWEHGPTELGLYSLAPGFYTFIVENAVGCVESYDVEIIDLQGCSMNYFLYESSDHCFVYVNIIVYDSNTGLPINSSALNIQWSDGSTAGLFRSFSKLTYGYYCVTITSSDPSQSCCQVDHCFEIFQDPLCKKKKKCKEVELLVNETSRREGGGRQFVELLVTGDCECEGRADIRGFYLDDNDGTLIPANGFISENNIENIGIDMGFLGFNYNPVWSSIPNGSLIVIYDENELGYENMPVDDPSDANQDNVYVLAANNTDFLFGKSGSWNQTTKLQEYNGTFVDPQWSLIEIDEVADGIQVRNQSGDHVHGISLGESSFSDINSFPLWLSSISPSSSHSRFVGTDVFLKNDYAVDPSDSNLQTPGLPNSILNQLFRDSLLYCDPQNPGISLKEKKSSTIKSRAEKENVKQGVDFVSAYPNPFKDEITLSINSSIAGKVFMSINAISGITLINQNFDCEQGLMQYQFKVGDQLVPGVYVLQLTLPSGTKKSIRIVHLDQY